MEPQDKNYSRTTLTVPPQEWGFITMEGEKKSIFKIFWINIQLEKSIVQCIDESNYSDLNLSGRAGRVEGKEKKRKVKVGVWREEGGIKRSGTAKMQVRNGAQSLFR